MRSNVYYLVAPLIENAETKAMIKGDWKTMMNMDINTVQHDTDLALVGQCS